MPQFAPRAAATAAFPAADKALIMLPLDCVRLAGKTISLLSCSSKLTIRSSFFCQQGGRKSMKHDARTGGHLQRQLVELLAASWSWVATAPDQSLAKPSNFVA